MMHYATGCFEQNADGITLRRVLIADYAKWRTNQRSTYRNKYPICRFPLLNSELPDEVVERVNQLTKENRFVGLRKFYKDVSEAQWRSIREFVLNRDGFSCAYCGDEAVTADHIISFHNLGSSHPRNLNAACLRCNSSKCATPLELWNGVAT